MVDFFILQKNVLFNYWMIAHCTDLSNFAVL